MQSFTINVLGQEISFKADADPERLEQARLMLDARFEILKQHGRLISREKLLTFLALALADDLLSVQEQQKETKGRLKKIINKIDSLSD